MKIEPSSPSDCCALASTIERKHMMPKGTRVKMTHSALRAGLDGRLSRKTGFVKSWSATYVHCLNVVRDGCKKSECFSAVWWERDTSHNDKVSYHADNAGGAHGKDTNDK